MVDAKTKLALIALVILALIIAKLLFFEQRDGDGDDPRSRGAAAARGGDDARDPVGGPGEVRTDRFVDRGAADARERPEGGADASVGSLRILVVGKRDGEPVPGANLRLQPLRGPNPFQHYRHFTADERGECLVTPWPTGRTRVSCPFGSKLVTVEPGEPTEVTLEVETGPALEGVVRDAEGAPIPGAEIVVARISSRYEGQAEAVTDSNGEFRLRSFPINGGHALQARARGYVASRAVLSMGRSGSTEKLEIVLRRPAAELSFTVVDSEGTPLPQAIVVVGEQDDVLVRRDDGRTSVGAFGVALRTDERGEVTVGCLPAGPIEVRIRDRAHVPWKREFVLAEGDRRHHRVTLSKGYRLTGLVRDQAGDPVPAAAVVIGPVRAATGHLARTDVDGRFVMDHVPAGEHVVRAKKIGMGEEKRDIVIGPDQDNDVRFTLGRLPSITGRVTDVDGQAVPGLLVEADLFEGRGVGGRGSVGSDGRFTIDGLDEADTYRLVVVSAKGVTLFQAPGKVRAGATDVHLVVPEDRLSFGSITGRLVGPDGAPVVGASVGVNLSRGAAIRQMEDATDRRGRFTLSGLAGGDYRLGITAPGLARKAMTVELAPGASRDLGTIELPQPGRIAYRATNPGNVSQKGLGAYLRRLPDGGTSWTDLSNTPALSDPLEPGRYHVSIRSRAVAIQARTVEVLPGKTITVEFEMAAGVPWAIAFSENLAAANSSVRVKITERMGNVVYDEFVNPRYQPERTLTLRLPAVPHTLELVLDDGERIRRPLQTMEEQGSIFIE